MSICKECGWKVFELSRPCNFCGYKISTIRQSSLYEFEFREEVRVRKFWKKDGDLVRLSSVSYTMIINSDRSMQPKWPERASSYLRP